MPHQPLSLLLATLWVNIALGLVAAAYDKWPVRLLLREVFVEATTID